MARKKRGKNYSYKETAYSSDGSGKEVGTYLTYDDGYVKTILNPSGKGAKYAEEIREKKVINNDGAYVRNKDGSVKKLTKEGQAYRAGYLDAQKDSANAWKAKRK